MLMNVSPIIGRGGVRLNITGNASTHLVLSAVGAFLGLLHMVNIGSVKVRKEKVSFLHNRAHLTFASTLIKDTKI